MPSVYYNANCQSLLQLFPSEKEIESKKGVDVRKLSLNIKTAFLRTKEKS